MPINMRSKFPYWKYGTAKFFLRVHQDLRQSDAYKVLKPWGKLILLYMIGTYQKASSFGQYAIPKGFRYTFSSCSENVSERTFYRTVEDICRVGFFSTPPEIQEGRPAAAKRYHSSFDWNSYKPTKEESRMLEQYTYRKTDRMDGKSQRLTNYRTDNDSE